MKVLCLDIGNSHTVIGVFDGDELAAHWEVSSAESRTGDEWHILIEGLLARVALTDIAAVSVCCTVPAILFEARKMLERYYGHLPVSIVGPGIRTGIAILTDNPREVGADRIVNALAAAETYGGPSIVVDFGTATTIDLIDAKGRYLGGAIAPGVELSLDALRRKSALLRSVELAAPRSVVGKNTAEAIQSGVIYGFAGQIDGIVGRMSRELDQDATVIATGNYAPVVVDNCVTITHRDRWLTLTGLLLVHRRNAERPEPISR